MITLSRRQLLAGAAVLAASASIPRAFAQAPSGPLKLDPLPYAPSKNEPHIDAQTMEIHHGRHHQAYVNNLNQVLSQNGELAKVPLHEMLAKLNDVPESVRTMVRNNGGGHANHTMFWVIMGGRGGEPTGELAQAVTQDFGDFATFRNRFNAAANGVFGSGWAFVTVTREGRLAIATKPNQDTPLMDGSRVLMGNDVWEHAYYLRYQNRRAEYTANWWNVLDWNRIAERYAAAKAGTLTI